MKVEAGDHDTNPAGSITCFNASSPATRLRHHVPGKATGLRCAVAEQVLVGSSQMCCGNMAASRCAMAAQWLCTDDVCGARAQWSAAADEVVEGGTGEALSSLIFS